MQTELDQTKLNPQARRRILTAMKEDSEETGAGEGELK